MTELERKVANTIWDLDAWQTYNYRVLGIPMTLYFLKDGRLYAEKYYDGGTVGKYFNQTPISKVLDWAQTAEFATA